jgi:hypothetical protein
MRFVQPLTEMLTLADGSRLTVKRRLTVGEQRESYRACSVDEQQEDGSWRSRPVPLLMGIAQVTAYLVDWDFRGEAGEDRPSLRGLDFAQRMAVIDANLDAEDFYEVRAAINAHEQAMADQRLAEKNGSGGERNAPAISPSPSVLAGASSGSAT